DAATTELSPPSLHDALPILINGAKMWITNGSMAHIAIIWAKTGDIDDPKSIRGFIVPTDTPGFSAKDQKGKLSLLASDTSELVRSEEHTSELQSRENLVCRL